MKSRCDIGKLSFVAGGLLFLAASGCAPLEPTPPEPVRPLQVLQPAPEFRPIPGSEGALREVTLFVEKLPTVRGRLEIRTITVRPRGQWVLPTTDEVALEVRSGDLEIVTNGERQKRRPGDIWVVAPGSRVTLNVLGQLAVLRAVYFIKENR